MDIDYTPKSFDEFINGYLETDHVPKSSKGWLKLAWDTAVLATEERLQAPKIERVCIPATDNGHDKTI